MKKIISILAIALCSTGVIANQPDWQKIFAGKEACFILYDLKTKKTIVEYNKKRCVERVFACSTFKIPIAIMAFDQGILKDENTVIKWDGVDRDYASWNQDQTAKTWLANSTVWVSQWITPQIGMPKIKNYLADFAYGNEDMSGGITKAWLSSSLKISAQEQIKFLKNFWQEKLNIAPRAIELTKKSIAKDISKHGDILYGKTGSGFLDGRDNPNTRRLGWFVGFVDHNKHNYVFATSMSDSKPPLDQKKLSGAEFVKQAVSSGEQAKMASKAILRDMGLYRD